MSFSTVQSSPTLIDSPRPFDEPTGRERTFVPHEDSLNSERPGLQLLHTHISAESIQNSFRRYKPPRCHPEAQNAVLDDIMSWVHAPTSRSHPSTPAPTSASHAQALTILEKTLILWLNGPAGTGKSSLMQAIAQFFSEKRLLAASFFNSASDTSRSPASPAFSHRTATNGHEVNSEISSTPLSLLIPTLAYQLTQTVPGLAGFVSRAVEKDRTIFSQRPLVQMEKLILEPLANAQANSRSTALWPKLIIIDGLDDIGADVEQQVTVHHQRHRRGRSTGHHNVLNAGLSSPPTSPTPPKSSASSNANSIHTNIEILSVLRKAAIDNRMPFRIVVSSRGNATINQQFTAPEFASITYRITLDARNGIDPNTDIRLYFNCRFSEIARRYGIGKCSGGATSGAKQWPSEADLDQLVYNAAGSFVYATTAVRFICLEADMLGTSSFTPNRPNSDVFSCDSSIPSPTAQIKHRLRLVVNTKFTKTYAKGGNDHAALDALYTCILNNQKYVLSTTDADDGQGEPPKRSSEEGFSTVIDEEKPMKAVRVLRAIQELLSSGVDLTYSNAHFFFDSWSCPFGAWDEGNLVDTLAGLKSVVYVPEPVMGVVARASVERSASGNSGASRQRREGFMNVDVAGNEAYERERRKERSRREVRDPYRFRFFDESFVHFLQDPSRSKSLYVPRARLNTDLALYYLKAATVHHESQPTNANHESLDQAAGMLSQLRLGKFCSFSIPYDQELHDLLSKFDIELWLFYAAGFKDMRGDVDAMYQWVHVECPWSGCTPVCRKWRRANLQFWDKLPAGVNGGKPQPTVMDRLWDRFTSRDMKRVKLITSRYRL
ncbi:hypothetical protein FA15DRAFT_666193 [Coprinopsis marcescibilis]|uniref:Nephrocystin 3-like N-terminal domain-containing protein n=1 Tax=Coprinopsis marcescibilis TaxID=230819 RepID=A0A5C3L6F2_COPMA|nr:hypothetical protein FA15DRAFT_666193 [Coprinopsis marcescibilis]